MFNSPVLDLVILLSFTYFIGSLILSAINEAIAGTFRLRQKDLGKGLFHFFLDPQWKSFVKNTLLKSPHLQTLMKTKGRMPAYIPPQNFVLALIENLDDEEYKKGNIKSKPTTSTTALNNTVPQKDIIPKDALIVLQTIMKQVSNLPADQRVQEFEKRVEEFYNNTMDRVTGWYKRRVRRILLALGFILAVILNIDTIKIANDAMQDKTRLGKAVDNITAHLPEWDSLSRSSIAVTDSAGNIEIKETGKNVSGVLMTYTQTTGYQLGYNGDFKKQWRTNFWKKLLGVLLTAFALQLGSNYWFDLMNKAVNVRATGKRPDENQIKKINTK
jgi:hypothetical protein